MSFLAGTIGLSLLALAVAWVIWRRYPRQPTGAPEAPRLHAHKERKRYISKARYLEFVGNLGERTAHQLEEATAAFNGIESALRLKFSPTELTFTRYYGAAEQAYLAILDNLFGIATTLNQANAVDPALLDKRHQALAPEDESNVAERRAIEERQRLRDEELKQAETLLALNETAITEFSRVRAALGALPDRLSEATLQLDTAVADLSVLADRAHKYALPYKEHAHVNRR